VLAGNSQPFEELPSQLLKPELQAPRPQAPSEHVAAACANEQTWLHVPQLLTSVSVDVSQPFEALVSQLPKPELHTGWHALDAQLVVPCWFVHDVPHVPQCVVVFVRFASQPFGPLPSQLPKPALQDGTHEPEVQRFVPFTAEHTVPHVPQFEVDVFKLASQPFVTLVSQLPKPLLHTMEHVADEHDGVPFVPLHAAPQEPQFAVLVLRFASQPLFGLLSQLANPELHVGTHAPVVQVVVPLAFVQLLPQLPQFPVLVFVFVSQPFEAMPSQLPNPALHD